MNPIVEIDAEFCQDTREALKREWLLTNGLGGYASSTILGCCNTRKYHGLLVYSSLPPLGRNLILSRFEEILTLEGQTYHLSPCFKPGSGDISGAAPLVNFRMAPYPLFTFAAGDWEIEKRIILCHGKNIVSIKYKVLYGNGKAKLTLIPYICFRGIHDLQSSNPDVSPILQINDPTKISIKFEPHDIEFYFIHNASVISPFLPSMEEFEYPIEKERGHEYREHLFKICEFHFDLSRDDPSYILSGSGDVLDVDPSIIRPEEVHRHRSIWRKSVDLHPEKKDDPVLSNLFVAADSFIVKYKSEINVMAGYPWFSLWTRDALISFPGLFLVTGRYEEARGFLLSLLRGYRDGLFPNYFPEEGDPPLYNTVDASLWFINGVYEYYLHTKDKDTIRTPLFDVVKDIIQSYISGTHFNIHQDGDCLIWAGEEGLSITWMDARIGEKGVTPRIGKNVEINALWHHALHIAAFLADLMDDEQLYAAYEIHAEKVRASFEEKFWYEEGEYLFDTIGENGPDPSIRPNQIFAVSLESPIINGEKAEKILNHVTRHLLTPFGLRSLVPGHPDYKPRYKGDQTARDLACHQGTVLPWLMGAYIDALLNVRGGSSETIAEAGRLLDLLIGHLNEAGLGSISEVFDGDPPHTPGGAVACAKSVAEVLRAYVKVLHMRSLGEA